MKTGPTLHFLYQLLPRHLLALPLLLLKLCKFISHTNLQRIFGSVASNPLYEGNVSHSNPLFSDNIVAKSHTPSISSGPSNESMAWNRNNEEAEEDHTVLDEDHLELNKVSKHESIVNFEIPRQVTIQSDEKPHKVSLCVLQLEAEFEYTIAPKLSKEAYLKAKIVNNSKYVLLQGPLNIFIDGSYVSQSSISNIVHTTESFAIFLGNDQGIKTLYFEEQNNKNQTGVFTKTSHKALSSKIFVSNNKNKPVVVVIFEQLPKSDNELVKVNLIEPKDAKQFENFNKIDLLVPIMITPQNNIRWRKELKPGSKLELKFNCIVEYPADRNINFY